MMLEFPNCLKVLKAINSTLFKSSHYVQRWGLFAYQKLGALAK